jgi:hypothetical protein
VARGARIVELKRRASRAAIPTVYVNDNFDAWHLGFRELVADVRASSPSARQLIDLAPALMQRAPGARTAPRRRSKSPGWATLRSGWTRTRTPRSR